MAKIRYIFSPPFLSGALTGLLAGIGAAVFFEEVVLKGSSSEQELTQVTLPKKITGKVERIKPIENKSIKKHHPHRKQPKDSVKQDKMDAQLDTVRADSTVQPGDSVDAAALVHLPDSLSLPEKETLSGGEMILIKRDRMLYACRVTCLMIEEQEQDGDSLSTLKRNTDEQQVFTVEFWRSPINYNGYKMGNNKILLFGLEPDDRAEVLLYKGTYYLGTNGQFYHLEKTFEYKPLSLVQDETLIRFLSE